MLVFLVSMWKYYLRFTMFYSLLAFFTAVHVVS